MTTYYLCDASAIHSLQQSDYIYTQPYPCYKMFLFGWSEHPTENVLIANPDAGLLTVLTLMDKSCVKVPASAFSEQLVCAIRNKWGLRA